MSSDNKQTKEQKNEFSTMDLHDCTQRIALDSRMNISDISQIFNEVRLKDARYYAWKLDRDLGFKMIGKVVTGGGVILSAMSVPNPSVLGAAFVTVAGLGLYIHGLRERRLSLSHLREDLAKLQKAEPK